MEDNQVHPLEVDGSPRVHIQRQQHKVIRRAMTGNDSFYVDKVKKGLEAEAQVRENRGVSSRKAGPCFGQRAQAGHDTVIGGACASNNSILFLYTTTMAPKFLTGDKAGIDDFLNKFDVRLDARLQINNILTTCRSSSSTVMVRSHPTLQPPE